MAYERPSVQIFQDFQAVPVEEIPELNACIIGPQYDFLDYSDADDKATAFVGLYDKSADTEYEYPGLASAAVLDAASVEVFFDDIEAEYFSHVAGAGPYEFNLVSGKVNQIRTNAVPTSDELIFKEFTNVDGTVFERSSAFLSRDVQVGDIIYIEGDPAPAGGDVFSVRTKVSGFVNEVIASDVEAAAADAGNQGVVAHSVGAAAADAGNTGDDTVASGGTYVGDLTEDVLTDTYTVEITTGGTDPVLGPAVADAGNAGDDAPPTIAGTYDDLVDDVYTIEVTTGGASGVAAVTVTSTEGDDSGPTVVTAATPFAIGTKGVTAEFATFGVDTDLTLGDIWTVPVTASAARLSVTTSSGTDDDAIRAFPGFGVAFEIGTRGVTVDFTDGGDTLLTVGDIWTIAVVKGLAVTVATSSGTYTGTNDKTYTVEVVQGGTYASGDAKISVTSSSVDSSGPTVVSAAATPVSVGTQGVAIAFAANLQSGLVLGDKWTIEVVAERKGAIKTLILEDKLPAELIAAPATDLTAILYLTQEDQEIARYRIDIPGDEAWVADEDVITIEDSIMVTDASWFDGLGLVPIPVDAARVHVTYRALRLEESADVGTVEADFDAIEARLGRIDSQNPLAFAVWKAAQNSADNPIKFVAIGSDDQEGYASALDIIEDRSDVYTLVPLTQDDLVHQDFEAHVDARSVPQNGQWRIALINRALVSTEDIYKDWIDAEGDTRDFLMTLADDPDTSGTQYTYLEAEDGQGVNFVADGVVPGHVVRLNFRLDADGETIWDDYVVDEVVSSTVLLLADGPDAAIPVSSKFELYKNLDKTAQAQAMAVIAASIANRRVALIWPDVVGIDGEDVKGFHLCAAIAGMVAALPPHQGFTNFSIIGFDDVSRTFLYFTRDQQDIMAEAGIYIVTQDALDTVPYTRHQLTTDTTTLEFQELSITKNVDNMSYFFQSLLASFIGVYNVTPDTLETIYGTVSSGIETLKNNIFARIGGQLIDATITDIKQDATFKTKVRVDLDVTIPYPLNNLELHLII